MWRILGNLASTECFPAHFQHSHDFVVRQSKKINLLNCPPTPDTPISNWSENQVCGDNQERHSGPLERLLLYNSLTRGHLGKWQGEFQVSLGLHRPLSSALWKREEQGITQMLDSRTVRFYFSKETAYTFGEKNAPWRQNMRPSNLTWPTSPLDESSSWLSQWFPF